jgi:uncharacterized protein with predicted RNA binding PUA domain
VSTGSLKSSPLERVRGIADVQFGRGVGVQLFPDTVEFGFSKTRRVRYILLGGERLATLRAHDGRLTLSMKGAAMLHSLLEQPAYRVYIDEQVAEFIARGKNAMAKHVTAADAKIRPGDEVLVVTSRDELIATGSAMLSGPEMLAFNYGVAVTIRKGC